MGCGFHPPRVCAATRVLTVTGSYGLLRLPPPSRPPPSRVVGTCGRRLCDWWEWLTVLPRVLEELSSRRDRQVQVFWFSWKFQPLKDQGSERGLFQAARELLFQPDHVCPAQPYTFQKKLLACSLGGASWPVATCHGMKATASTSLLGRNLSFDQLY